MKKLTVKILIFSLMSAFILPLLALCFTAKPVMHSHDYMCSAFDGASDSTNASQPSSIGVDETSTFTKLYFSHLTKNFGHNWHDTCGYVALGMLLSYYDTYWNDDIIPEKYDAEGIALSSSATNYLYSPGTVETDEEIKDANEYYKNVLNNLYNTSFHAYLLKVGNSLGYNNETNIYKIENILKTYLDSNLLINKDDFYISTIGYLNNYKDIVPGKSYTYNEQMRKDIISYVKAGYPIYMSIVDENETKAHAVIAYDYDETTDTLYSHFGGQSSATHTRLEDKDYKYIRGYMYISPTNLQHKHSNNIKCHGTEKYYCSCELSNHAHKFTYKYLSDLFHTSTCYCGYKETNKHTFDIIGKNYVCRDCRFSKPYDGKWIPVTIESNNLIDDLLYTNLLSGVI